MTDLTNRSYTLTWPMVTMLFLKMMMMILKINTFVVVYSTDIIYF